jgi:hypothetical protein
VDVLPQGEMLCSKYSVPTTDTGFSAYEYPQQNLWQQQFAKAEENEQNRHRNQCVRTGTRTFI